MPRSRGAVEGRAQVCDADAVSFRERDFNRGAGRQHFQIEEDLRHQRVVFAVAMAFYGGDVDRVVFSDAFAFLIFQRRCTSRFRHAWLNPSPRSADVGLCLWKGSSFADFEQK